MKTINDRVCALAHALLQATSATRGEDAGHWWFHPTRSMNHAFSLEECAG